MTDLATKLRWEIKVQLERPANYDKRVTLTAADVTAVLDAAESALREHAERTFPGDPDWQGCDTCEAVWPCPTVSALSHSSGDDE